jgi:hypothetical protein
VIKKMRLGFIAIRSAIIFASGAIGTNNSVFYLHIPPNIKIKKAIAKIIKKNG